MFHNIIVTGNSDELSAIKKDITRNGLRTFLGNIEFSNEQINLEQLETSSTKNCFFLSNSTSTENSINIDIACNSNNGIFKDLFSGITSKYSINANYKFYCPKILIAGEINYLGNDYSIRKYNSYDDICNDISSVLLSADLIERLDYSDIDSNGIGITLIDSKKNKSFGMEYIENKYRLKLGKAELFYNVSLDRVLTTNEVPRNNLIEKDGKSYFSSAINWSNFNDFKVEGIMQDMDSSLIISNLFKIMSLREAC